LCLSDETDIFVLIFHAPPVSETRDEVPSLQVLKLGKEDEELLGWGGERF
jgi:hypothetical protein